MENLLVLVGGFYAMAIAVQVMCGASAMKKAKAHVAQHRVHANMMAAQNA
jgi:hypothetical protein